tara:strand:+ start:2004 stop:2561 length:558 start_codon:yes stop_codon:yes gene_type:complete
MSNYAGTKYDFDGSNLTDITLVSTGTVLPWGEASVPSGYLECNGQAVSRSTYAALFAIVSTTYGSGNGSTTFNVPDLKDNAMMGRSNSAALASTGGANTVQTTGNVGGSAAAHTLTSDELPSHSHTGVNIGQVERGSGGPNVGTIGGFQSAGGGGSHTHNMSATFTGDSTSVLQPYLTVLYIIKT